MATFLSPPHPKQSWTGPSKSTRAEIVGLDGSPVIRTNSLGYFVEGWVLEGWLELEVFAKRANDGSLDFRKSRRPDCVVWASAVAQRATQIWALRPTLFVVFILSPPAPATSRFPVGKNRSRTAKTPGYYREFT